MTRASGKPGLQDRYRTRYLKLRSVLYDRTTGLPAYPVLLDRLRVLLEGRRHLGVLHVALHNVELVESLYGWQVFDRVLARAATELRDLASRDLPPDSLVSLSQVVGDSFVLFVPATPDGGDVDGKYLGRVGRSVRCKLDAAFGDEEFRTLSPKLDVRVGQSLLSRNPFYRFERRLQVAVEEARSFDERRSRRRESSWADDLQQIIQDAAVDTLFQPVVDLRTNDVIGYEALARGPRDSPLEAPRTMFALSDRVGVSADLDRICRESALRASAAMGQSGKIFLNVLPVSLGSGEWQEGKILTLLQAARLEPRDVVLEFSERNADADPDGFVDTLQDVKQRGFGLALDDIGTGHSSQSILERLEPDYLKLDVTLVRDIHENLIKQELLSALVRLAERIGAAVIAEGVETQDEAATLRELGTHYGQGFLFSMPVSAAALSLSRDSRATDH